MSIERVTGKRPKSGKSAAVEKVKTGVDKVARREYSAGAARAVLAHAVNHLFTQITVTDPIGFPAFAVGKAAMPVLVIVEDELMEVVQIRNTRDGLPEPTTTWTVVRGAEGTVPMAHAAGTPIIQAIPAFPRSRPPMLLVVAGKFGQYDYWRKTFKIPQPTKYCTDEYAIQGMSKVPGDEVVFFGSPGMNPSIMKVLKELVWGGWLAPRGERYLFEEALQGAHTFRWDVTVPSWEETDEHRGFFNSTFTNGPQRIPGEIRGKTEAQVEVNIENQSDGTMTFPTTPSATLLPGDRLTITQKFQT
jgi:hypothetical protein